MGIEAGEVVAADVCVVGAGPAGLTLAERLLGGGMRVVVLESGGAVPGDAVDLAHGEVAGYPYHRLEDTQVRAVGGSWHGWDEWMRARPLDPVDLDTRPWVPASGWPIGWQDLEPHYRWAHEALGLGVWAWGASAAETPPPSALTGGGLDPVVFRYSNTVDFAAVRHRLEGAADAILVEHATALEVLTDPGGRSASGVVAAGDDGHRFEVTASVVVLAAGGIGNPRLLLASRSAGPDGLGNEADQVGRCFMEHPRVRIGVVHGLDPEALGFFERRSGPDGTVRGALTPSPDAQASLGILNAMALLAPVDTDVAGDEVRSLAVVAGAMRGRPSAESVSGHALNLARHPIAATRAIGHRLGRGRRGEPVHHLSFTVEQPPRPESRVTLGDSRDRLGVPEARLDWRVGDEERRTVRELGRMVDAELRRHGAGRVEGFLGDERPARVFYGEWHPMGTTRMSVDPAEGVVDTDLGVHGVDGLFVVGSSVFPTVGHANPTLTIVALADRLAGHLAKRLVGEPLLGPLW